MLVAEFVQRLHPYFKHYNENNGIKPYMQHLICKCFNLSKEDYSEASALRDYKGENEDGEIVKDGPIFRDHIHHFAKKNEKLYDVKSAAGYIEECTRDILNKEQLCQDFADEIPDICVSNYPTKLAEHLRQLLQNAARTETKTGRKKCSSTETPKKQPKSADNDGVKDAFSKTYSKEMKLSDISSGIRAKIWEMIDEMIRACQAFESKTLELFRLIDLLNESKETKNEAVFKSNYPTYEQQREVTERGFNEILKLLGKLYTTFANITEIREIVRISFSHTLMTPPDNRVIHIAGSNTKIFIDKLRQLSEDYLFM